jgi:hypothetical protein
MLAIGASVLAAAAGLAFGLLVPTVARADDPPPTTVPTPTVPTPDPAPPKPKPKPASKPTPKPTSTPRHVSPTPTYQPPVASSSQHATTVKPKPRTHVRPKKKVRHKKTVVQKKTTVLPKVTAAPSVGAAGVQVALKTKSDGSIGLASLLVVLGLSFAIACFAVAAVPATAVKWRPAAIFVSERQVDLTLVGVALLVGAAFTFLVAKGL